MDDSGTSDETDEFPRQDESSEASTNPLCLNCGAALTGKFCAQCGQKVLPKRQTLGELFINFIGSFTSFESKFFRTVRHLLFNPGFLSMEFNAGRRESYYHPARAYVFISFVFFLILALSSNDKDLGFNYSFTYESSDSPGTKQTISFDTLVHHKSQAAYDSVQNTLPAEQRDNWIERALQRRVIELNQKYLGRGDQFLGDINRTIFNNFPKVFFLLLPVFALLLKLLYRRHDFYYSEHLVFTIHYYNFFYLTSAIAILIAFISWLAWIKYIVGIWIMVYLLLAMKRVYKQRWAKTVANYVLFGLMFAICMVVGLLINLLVSLFTV